MARRYFLHGIVVILIALLVLVVIRLHSVSGASAAAEDTAEGHRLAEAWCKGCHLIEIKAVGTTNTAPDFAAIANHPTTTELSLKVFLRTNHRSMPNLILSADQTDALVRYILSLKGKRKGE